MSVVESLKRPEYIGENRCTPCTIANSVIAVAGSAGLSWGVVTAGVGGGVAAGVGAVALGVAMAAIYLRGYLVPYTPTLTKRYFPDWLLAMFDKRPDDPAGGATPEHRADDDVDPESVLLSAGAVEPCAHEDDFCLADDYRSAWYEEMRHVAETGVETDDIVSVLDLDLDVEAAALTHHGEAILLTVHDQELGKWESDAALVADVAGAEVLAERYDAWAGLSAADRSAVLRGLRVFADACPLCGGDIELGQRTEESCCRSYEVVAVTCTDCGARLFEQPADRLAAD